jgi:hypothetical protein
MHCQTNRAKPHDTVLFPGTPFQTKTLTEGIFAQLCQPTFVPNAALVTQGSNLPLAAMDNKVGYAGQSCRLPNTHEGLLWN